MANPVEHSPHPPCPQCQSERVFRIQHDASAPADFYATQGWVIRDGVCDVRPERWTCNECDFRWYPRKDIERDLDYLHWQLSEVLDQFARDHMQDRIKDLRIMITLVASSQ